MVDEVRGMSFEVGDRVRIDIPDETHPDHRHHGTNGVIIAILDEIEQAASGRRRGTVRVDLDTGEVIDVNVGYVRPPI